MDLYRDSYVSASWYSDPQMGSTWNYMSIHCYGRLEILSGERLLSIMQELTLKYEGGDSSSPTVIDNLPDSYVEKMLPGIVGFEIKVEKMKNVFKLSQNRDEASYRNVISKLEIQGGKSAAIAEEMKKRLNSLFPK